jgi:hypothetical protein
MLRVRTFFAWLGSHSGVKCLVYRPSQRGSVSKNTDPATGNIVVAEVQGVCRINLVRIGAFLTAVIHSTGRFRQRLKVRQSRSILLGLVAINTLTWRAKVVLNQSVYARTSN